MKNYKISIVYVIFIIVMIVLILSDKKQKPTDTLIQSATSTNTDDISNVSFKPSKVALRNDDNNPGAIKLTDFCFPVGTILFWSSNTIPEGWESINILNNNWTGRFPIARSDSTNVAASKYNVVGVMGGSTTPTPLPPYFTVGYIIKKSFESTSV